MTTSSLQKEWPYKISIAAFCISFGSLVVHILGLRVRVMVFNATFNNISVILWPSVLLYMIQLKQI